MKREEREWEGKAVQDGELAAMKAEEREWEGKAVQDGELAAMEERERERHLEKSQGGEDDAEGGAGMEGENRRKWAEVWASDVCS